MTGPITIRRSEALGDAFLNWLAAGHHNSGLKLYKSSTKTQEYSGKGRQIEFDQVKVKEFHNAEL